MNFHGASAVDQAYRLAMTADEEHRAKDRHREEFFSHEPESPTLAGYLVYVVTVIGFVTMCVLSALR